MADFAQPYLEYFPSQSGLIRRIPLQLFPFILGRSSTAHFEVACPRVSKAHAAIERAGPAYQIRDLNSTNGTYVNGRQISVATLANDSIIQLAHEEFRFVTVSNGGAPPDTAFTERVDGKVPLSVVLGAQHLREMLLNRSFRILFQPIVSLETGEPLGYEALARGTHSNLSMKPTDLFHLAKRCGMAESLSQMFRKVAVEEAGQLPGAGHIFLNVHPSEINHPSFLESLMELQGTDRQLVLEIHEDAMADLPVWKSLRLELKKLGIQVAYDDFGAGQARFLELAEYPPEFLKLDMKLIHDIHLVRSRQHLIEALTRVSTELGVQVIAEGVETLEEEDTCRMLGCHFGQGYLFAQPQAAAAFMCEAQPKTLAEFELPAV